MVDFRALYEKRFGVDYYVGRLYKVKGKIEKLAYNDSRIFKERFIRENKDDNLFLEVLKYLTSPYIRTGIQESKLSKFEDVFGTSTITNWLDALACVAVNNSGLDHIIKDICKFINSYPENLRPFLKSLITKSFKLGASSKTINKALGFNWVPEFNVMLAKEYSDHQHKLIDKQIIITPKIDGIRCVYIDGVFYSRTGQIIEGLEEITDSLKHKYLNPNFVFDGELLYNKKSKNSNDRYTKTCSIVRSDNKNKKDITYHIFDILMLQEWETQTNNAECIGRKSYINSFIFKLEIDTVKFVPILYFGTYKEEEIQSSFDRSIKNGYEGIMINLNVPYEFKRTDKLLKLKAMKTIDLKIVGFEEGSGRNSDTLGALIVEYKGNTLKVGSGYSDSYRNKIWENKEKYLGKIIEVQYFEESKNKEGVCSLRFPVFLRFRMDNLL